ncbi:hypothetical protein AOLI_G00286070 [Acnodon oligacanthus]
MKTQGKRDRAKNRVLSVWASHPWAGVGWAGVNQSPLQVWDTSNGTSTRPPLSRLGQIVVGDDVVAITGLIRQNWPLLACQNQLADFTLRQGVSAQDTGTTWDDERKETSHNLLFNG